MAVSIIDDSSHVLCMFLELMRVSNLPSFRAFQNENVRQKLWNGCLPSSQNKNIYVGKKITKCVLCIEWALWTRDVSPLAWPSIHSSSNCGAQPTRGGIHMTGGAPEATLTLATDGHTVPSQILTHSSLSYSQSFCHTDTMHRSCDTAWPEMDGKFALS